MTCIVGVETDKGVLIGADSAGTGGWSQTIRADEKVWRSGEFVYGFTSSFRMGQRLPNPGASQGERDRWMTTELLRYKLSLPLVGWRGSLYAIHSDFQVGRSVRGEDAVGSGGALARGALFVAKGEPRLRVKKALEAASLYNAAVAPPFKIVLGGKP